MATGSNAECHALPKICIFCIIYVVEIWHKWCAEIFRGEENSCSGCTRCTVIDGNELEMYGPATFLYIHNNGQCFFFLVGCCTASVQNQCWRCVTSFLRFNFFLSGHRKLLGPFLCIDKPIRIGCIAPIDELLFCCCRATENSPRYADMRMWKREIIANVKKTCEQDSEQLIIYSDFIRIFVLAFLVFVRWVQHMMADVAMASVAVLTDSVRQLFYRAFLLCSLLSGVFHLNETFLCQ